jgi:hypothetical protein
MKAKELWNYFQGKRVFYSRPFDRDFIWVAKEDFEAMESHFATEFNLFHMGQKSMRSRHYIAHVHAIHEGDYVFLHQDTGNLARFLPLAIVHFFLDVLPYLFYSKMKGIPSEARFMRPQ